MTVPDEGGSRAPSTCSRELLPLPEGPVTTAASPGLRPNVTSDSVLAEIATRPDMHLQCFELAVPSLNDIFVQVVTG